MKGIRLGAYLLMLVAGGAQAQRTSLTAEMLFADPEAVVTTATRSERSMETTPMSVQVLKRAALTNWRTVQEALERHLPDGIALEGSLTRFLSIRGSFSSAEFNERTLVMLNGVPLNDPVLGHVPLMAFPTLPLEQIEVVYGPGSALYGANAFAGVVALQTASPPTRQQWGVQVGGEALAGQNLALWAVYPNGRPHFSTFAWMNDDGGNPNIHNATRSRLWQSAFRWELSPSVQWSLKTLWLGMERGINGRTVAHPGTPHDSHAQHLFQWVLEREAGAPDNTRSVIRLYGQHGAHRFHRENIPTLLEAPYQRLGAEIFWQRPYGHTCWTLGAEARQEQASGNLLRQPVHTSSWSVLTQAEYTLHPLSLVMGWRHDYHSGYGTQRTFRGALTYTLTPSLTARASYGTAFRAPNFAELYSKGYWIWTPTELDFAPVYVMGDPRLRPERITAWEIGFRYTLHQNASLDLSYFDKDHRDLISLELHEGHSTGITWRHAHYRNLMHYHVQGLALWMVWNWSPSQQLTIGGYRLLSQHWSSHDTHPIVRQFDLAHSRLTTTFSSRVTDRLAVSLTAAVPPYNTKEANPLLTLSLRYQPQPEKEWFLSIDNLLNTTYSVSPLLHSRGMRLSVSYRQKW